MTVGHRLDQWLDTIRGEVTPKTHERYADVAESYLVPALGNAPLTKLSSDPNPKRKQRVGHGQARRQAWGPFTGTRRYIHHILKAALSRAVEQQVLVRNPATVLRPPKIERQEMTTLSTEQSARLLETIRHIRLYWPVLSALSTGMRRGEISH